MTITIMILITTISYFTNFEQVKKKLVILLTLNKFKMLIIMLTWNKSKMQTLGEQSFYWLWTSINMMIIIIVIIFAVIIIIIIIAYCYNFCYYYYYYYYYYIFCYNNKALKNLSCMAIQVPFHLQCYRNLLYCK